MDIRGIEVTNQLRSAIRAKLLELGVRYDEELPDYILVMVVNKKSRQQMHEDLYLFLEKCTTPFVDWLHDQVLKKLQKVTVAKKKTLRELVPTVVVKQEEEKKKKKICTTSFLEDQTVDPSADKSSNKNPKDEKSFQKPSAKSSVIASKSDAIPIKAPDKPAKTVGRDAKSDTGPSTVANAQIAIKKAPLIANATKETAAVEIPSVDKDKTKAEEVLPRNLKRPLDAVSSQREALEKKPSDAKRSKIGEDPEDDEKLNENAKKLKSCINKPKITSVVSVKNRLGVISPRKKFEKPENDNRYRQNEKRFERNRFENNRNNSFQRGRIFDAEERLRRNREMEAKHAEVDKVNDIRTRLGNAKMERTQIVDSREKGNANLKGKLERSTGTIKDRLGIANSNKQQRQLDIQSQESLDPKTAKVSEPTREVHQLSLSNNKNIKNRLGPLKNHFRPLTVKTGFNSSARRSQSSEDEDCLNLGAEDELEDDAQSIAGNGGPIKSHIIAVNKLPVKTERKRLKMVEKLGKESYASSDAEEGVEDAKIPSKVIVTPRPLKPLQPTQKRATQSLLLRAVAEANQSVVTQKNPEPSLLEKKAAVKHLKPVAARDVGQNLSVHFNSSKRLVMEKIQVELNTVGALEAESKSYVPQPVTEEQMGVVMSLFQRSDDNQKFLVTLNGYNNNLAKEKTVSDDDERLEMECIPSV